MLCVKTLRVVLLIVAYAFLIQMAVPTGAGRIPVLGMGSVCTSVAAYVAVDAISTRRTRRTTAIGRRRPPLLQDATPVVLVARKSRRILAIVARVLDVTPNSRRQL